MRIIDNKTDFYDYLQNIYKDDSITFDRRDSFILKKEDICLELSIFTKASNCAFLELQVGSRFWLLLVVITKRNEDGNVCEYTLDLMDTWKNYNKPSKMIDLNLIEFSWSFTYSFRRYNLETRRTEWDVNSIMNGASKFTAAVDNNDFKILANLCKKTVHNGDGSREEKHIPILNRLGLVRLVDPLNVYLALEEYFLMKRQESERTDSVGITDIDRLENHGFDKKLSFRNQK